MGKGLVGLGFCTVSLAEQYITYLGRCNRRRCIVPKTGTHSKQKRPHGRSSTNQPGGVLKPGISTGHCGDCNPSALRYRVPAPGSPVHAGRGADRAAGESIHPTRPPCPPCRLREIRLRNSAIGSWPAMRRNSRVLGFPHICSTFLLAEEHEGRGFAGCMRSGITNGPFAPRGDLDFDVL